MSAAESKPKPAPRARAPQDLARSGVQVRGASKRRAPRTLLTCLVWLEGLGTSEEHPEGVARALDLSSLGAGLLAAGPVEPGTSVRVELLIPPTNLRLRTTGQVVHARELELEAGWRIGVRFDAPPVLADGPDETPYRPSELPPNTQTQTEE